MGAWESSAHRRAWHRASAWCRQGPMQADHAVVAGCRGSRRSASHVAGRCSSAVWTRWGVPRLRDDEDMDWVGAHRGWHNKVTTSWWSGSRRCSRGWLGGGAKEARSLLRSRWWSTSSASHEGRHRDVPKPMAGGRAGQCGAATARLEADDDGVDGVVVDVLVAQAGKEQGIAVGVAMSRSSGEAGTGSCRWLGRDAE